MPLLPKEPQPGDLIEFTYKGDKHWAIYEGSGYVIHLAPKRNITWGESFDNLLKWCNKGVVTRNLLKDVARDNDYKVTNIADSKLKRSQKDILRTAKSMLGKEMEYKDLSKESKNFGIFLRDGLDCKAEFCELPQPGDMIEIFCGDYQHWAIFQEDGYVIHLAPLSVLPPGSPVSSLPPLIALQHLLTLSLIPEPTCITGSQKVEVKWERLKVVAKYCKYRVNNHLDDKCSPLPVKKILSAMRDKVGQQMEFEDWKNKSEAFAIYLRYGLITTDPFCDSPKAGDMIEIFRILYQHWAIYERDGYVIHLVPPDDLLGKENIIYSIGFGRAVVKRQPLKDVVNSCLYRINNYLDGSQQPRHKSDILRDARDAIGKEMNYDLLYLNCEHFATCMRYRFPFSAQAKSIPKWLQKFKKNAESEIVDMLHTTFKDLLTSSVTPDKTINACNGICSLDAPEVPPLLPPPAYAQCFRTST